jgi:[ribosomal protein S18]-alanine N-acetyltransferase
MKTTSIITIVELEASVHSFLEDFLFEAIYIPDGSPPPDKSIIFQPDLYCYIKDFGRKHDLGFIIEANNKPVGAIWTRIFSEEQKGYGFVNNKTPELSMAINPDFRNQGFGTQLLEKMLFKLQESDYKKVSLSVDKRNFAYQIYLKFGFQEHQIEGNTVVMVKIL